MLEQRNLIDQCIAKIYNEENKKKEEEKNKTKQNKVNALNILVCHEQVIERLDNLIMQIQ